VTNQALQYYIHDEPDAFRLELSGMLSGDGAHSVYHAWQTALSIIGKRPLIVDLTYIVDADEPGRTLIRLWRRSGARIVAASAKSRALAGSILGEYLPEPPAPRGFVHWLRAIAGFSTLAGRRRATSAALARKTAEIIASPGGGDLERRVPK
jgi:hypothetical protein